MKNRKILFIISGLIFILFTKCKNDDDICYQTITNHDGHGNTWESQLEYPCHLGPPVDAPVNGKTEIKTEN